MPHKSANSKNAIRGIALIEVLVTVTVVSVGLTATLTGIRTCVRAQSIAEQRATLQVLAEEQLARLRILSPAQLESELSGTFAAPNEAYSWSAEIDPVDETTPYRVVQFTIRTKSRDSDESDLSLRTLL